MKKIRIVSLTIIVLNFIFSTIIFSQQDSIWSVMVLKKGNKPDIKENMAQYSSTGFYLYRNCFYDLEFIDGTKKTLRLIDIKQDTLVFIGVSLKNDVNLSITSTDTSIVDFRNIKYVHLVKNWTTNSSKKIKLNDFYFIFNKTDLLYKFESKYEFIFPDSPNTDELVPRLSNFGITYHYEYNGKLHYHSGIKVKTPRFTDEQMQIAINSILIILDVIINVSTHNNSIKSISPKTIRKR